jgi:Flp pilus assembly protein CpaB
MSMNTGPSFPGPAGFPAPGSAIPPTAASGLDGDGKRKRGKKQASPRRFGVLAIVLAVLTGVVLLVLLGGTVNPDKTYVLRARENLNPTLDVAAQQVEAVPIDPAAVDPGAIQGASAAEVLAFADGTEAGPDGSDWRVVGRRTRSVVYAGQQIRPEMFLGSPSGIAVELADGDRLVSVEVPASRALAGGLAVGDRVDVAVFSPEVTGLVAENVQIVAIQADASVLSSAQQRQASDGTLTPSDVLPSDPIPGTYVLLVPADRAVPLVAAEGTGKLYLLGRTPLDAPISNGALNLRDAVCSSPSNGDTDVCRGL